MLGSWVVLVDPAGASADEQDLVELINTIIRISVAFTLVLTTINAALEVRRFVRMDSPTRSPNRRTPVAQCGP